MTTFGSSIPDADEPAEDPTVVFIESADPVDLQSKVNAYLASLDINTTVITNMTLAGAGDGHVFMVLIETTSPSFANNGLPAGLSTDIQATLVRCYVGGSEEELVRARLGAGVPPPVTSGLLSAPYSLVDEQMVGSAKGQRFMGMSIYVISTLPPGIALRPRVLGNGTAGQALNAGTTILTFANINNESKFVLFSPQEIQYTGFYTLLASVEASVSVTQDNAGDFSVAIVKDPLGTPSVITSMVSHTEAGETDTVTVFEFTELIPIALQDTRFGLLVTSGAGTSEGAQLRITAELG